ncbi:MAG: sulfatase-like hydrolase/transferase [Blastochloris sp.]|nr:sulfatase-like hydrolase/transferase [Blastochloris sp.]
MKPCNVLWISLEDCSPRLGCYGEVVARTPNMDRLAAEGCRYTRAFSTAPVCAPARCAVITGMFAAGIGAQHMRTTHVHEDAAQDFPPYEAVPPPQVRLIPEYLRAEGYFAVTTPKQIISSSHRSQPGIDAIGRLIGGCVLTRSSLFLRCSIWM